MIAHLVNSLYGLFCRPPNTSNQRLSDIDRKDFGYMKQSAIDASTTIDITFSAVFAFCILREGFYIFGKMLIVSSSYK